MAVIGPGVETMPTVLEAELPFPGVVIQVDAVRQEARHPEARAYALATLAWEEVRQGKQVLAGHH